MINRPRLIAAEVTATPNMQKSDATKIVNFLPYLEQTLDAKKHATRADKYKEVVKN